MLVPRLTLAHSPVDVSVLRLGDATGDQSTSNPGGFGGTNATRAQVSATLTITRSSDGHELLPATSLPSDFFTSGREYDFPINFGDASASVTISVFSKYGQPVPMYSYLLPPRAYVAGSLLAVQKGSSLVDVTAQARISGGYITWIINDTLDKYSQWVLSSPSGAILASGNLTQTDVKPSPTVTQTGADVALIGQTSQFFMVDTDFKKKLASIAETLVSEPNSTPALSPRLGAWGKLYYDYQALLLEAENEVPTLTDARLTRLHLMADRLL